jgi:hypothetical protein
VVDRLGATHKAAQQQLDAGAENITAADVNRTVVYLRPAEARLPQASQGVKRAQAALREAVGLPPDGTLNVSAMRLSEPEARPSQTEVVAAALARSGDLAQAHLLAEVGCLEVRAQDTTTHQRISVLFSYYTTLGVTFALSWLLDPHGFTGIDWKVAMFLFTILIAVGEDYNIFLMTRVDEGQRRHGPLRGITSALERTGPIISSCGIIMAGTFASLLAGSFTEMKQLGFALALGVVLDTFVVRPILVPTFLILLARPPVLRSAWRWNWT